MHISIEQLCIFYGELTKGSVSYNTSKITDYFIHEKYRLIEDIRVFS